MVTEWLWAGYRMITGDYEVVMYYHSKARPKITSSRFLVQFNIMIYSMINNISEHLVIDIDVQRAAQHAPIIDQHTQIST